jgi:hypothetical protein
VRRELTASRRDITDIEATAVCELRGGWLIDFAYYPFNPIGHRTSWHGLWSINWTSSRTRSFMSS